jgi:hypothetical protein
VVSIDGSATYSDQQFQNVLFNVEGALQNLNINDAGHLAAEFSRLMLWLHRHLPLIAPSGFRNEVVFTPSTRSTSTPSNHVKVVFSVGAG